MIADVIKLLGKSDFKGAGKLTEIAKGKNELNLRTQIKRLWLLRNR